MALVWDLVAPRALFEVTFGGLCGSRHLVEARRRAIAICTGQCATAKDWRSARTPPRARDLIHVEALSRMRGPANRAGVFSRPSRGRSGSRAGAAYHGTRLWRAFVSPSRNPDEPGRERAIDTGHSGFACVCTREFEKTL
jgi:hypothetical protein